MSQLVEVLSLKYNPIAVVFTDDKPIKALQFKEGGWGCVGSMLWAAARGKQVVFSNNTSGCPGGGTGLGFGDCYKGFPIERLLSTGGKNESVKARTIDMGEGERFFESPEIADRWVQGLPYRESPTKFIVCKPLELVEDGENVTLVLMFVNPDQLSALITLAGFRRGTINTTISPWGAACQSILFALKETESDSPRGVIGFFDMSQRGKIDKELLTYTMPFKLYLEMESSVDDSFLRTSVWHKLRER